MKMSLNLGVKATVPVRILSIGRGPLGKRVIVEIEGETRVLHENDTLKVEFDYSEVIDR